MSIDELPEEQLDHILRYFLCDSERQGDGDTPQSWLRVPGSGVVGGAAGGGDRRVARVGEESGGGVKDDGGVGQTGKRKR